MRPRCCLRYLTFFGINIKISSQFSAVSSQENLPASRSYLCNLTSDLCNRLTSKRSRGAQIPRRRCFPLLCRQNLALINPTLHATHAVGSARLGEAVVDI